MLLAASLLLDDFYNALPWMLMWTETGPFGTKVCRLVYLISFDGLDAMRTLSLYWLLDEGVDPGLLATHLTATPSYVI